ncbi:MAG: hypothetical protein A4S09_08180 [Proteobacteria bacterium SG_bin7]|nr:MAG: hypothetical protein A4S09_08180 [Proteobacteria bacterium SG_bin7]
MKNYPRIKKFVRFFSNLKIAVAVIVVLGIITAYGTIMESRYNTMTAQKLIYHSWSMYTIQGFLCFILIMVMIDRWPWKKHQIGFVMAHIGLITLLYGSFVTKKWGVDGTLSFGIGQSSRAVVVDDIDFLVFGSFDGINYKNLHIKTVDFFLNPPTKERPYKVSLPPGDLVIDEYAPYAFVERKIVPRPGTKKGAGLRFQLQNQFANILDWVVQREEMRGATTQFGPLTMVLVTGDYQWSKKSNEIVLFTQGDKPELKYKIYSQKEGKEVRSGALKIGDEIVTPWMGMTFRVINYYPRAEEETHVIARDYPTQLTTQAIKVNFNGESRWQPLNQPLRFFTESEAYVVEYRNREIILDFDLYLKEFKMGTYQGTSRASSYQSLVSVPDLGDITISMNEPLKHRGFTFYQASFQQDNNGKPVASILSVNRDPGRFIKYLGSICVVLGTILMFHYRNNYFGKQKKEAA